MNKIISLLLGFFTIFFSCIDSNLPKQGGFLRIEFPEPNYIAPKEIKLTIKSCPEILGNENCDEIITETMTELYPINLYYD